MDFMFWDLIPVARMMPEERAYSMGLVLWMLFELVRVVRSEDKMAIWQPRALLAGIFFYYCVLGPLHCFREDDYRDRGIMLRYVFVSGWQGALVAAAAFCAGEAWSDRLGRHLVLPFQRKNVDIWRIGFRVFSIGILLYASVVGLRFFGQLNPISVRDSDLQGYALDYGAFRSYASYGLNVAFAGCGVMLASFRANRLLITAVSFFVLLATSVTIGFRYRLVLLVLMAVAVFVSSLKRRIGLPYYAALAGLLILAGGYIGATRSYGSGLDTNRVEGFEAQQFVSASVSEANVFMTTGGVIFHVPRHSPHIGMLPLLNALVFPLPRGLAPWKGDAGYITNVTAIIYGDPIRASGTAFLSYAEYYLMFGWAGVVGGYGLLGWLYGICWRWFLQNREDPIVRVCYALTAAFLYVVVSRGYLSQVLMLFCFTVLPAFALHRYYSEPMRTEGRR